MTTESDNNNSPVIGIELGVGECRVGVYQDGKVTIFQDDGDNLDKGEIPSWVHFKKNGKRVIGRVAMELAEEHFERSIFVGSLLELLGRKDDDPDIVEPPCGSSSSSTTGNLQSASSVDMFHHRRRKPGISVQVGGAGGGGQQERDFYVEQAVAMLLGGLKEIAERKLGRVVTRAVLTIPTGGLHFRRTHRLRQCAAIAGFTDVGFLSRCHAALIWFVLNPQKDDDEDDEAKKNSFVKVIDFEVNGDEQLEFSTSVADVKVNEKGGGVGVLEEVFTSGLGGDNDDKRRIENELSLKTGGQVPAVWLLTDCSPTQRETAKNGDIQGEQTTTPITLAEFQEEAKSCIVSGAAAYAATMMKKESGGGGGGLLLKPSFPGFILLVNDHGHDGGHASAANTYTVVAKHDLFNETQKHTMLINSKVSPEGVLRFKVYEGYKETLEESGFLGTFHITNFVVKNGTVEVEVALQLSFINGTFDVTAICKRSGGVVACDVVFENDWFASCFSKERLEGLRLEEVRLRSNGKKPREIIMPCSSSSSAAAAGTSKKDRDRTHEKDNLRRRRRRRRKQSTPTSKSTTSGGDDGIEVVDLEAEILKLGDLTLESATGVNQDRGGVAVKSVDPSKNVSSKGGKKGMASKKERLVQQKPQPQEKEPNNKPDQKLKDAIRKVIFGPARIQHRRKKFYDCDLCSRVIRLVDHDRGKHVMKMHYAEVKKVLRGRKRKPSLTSLINS